MANDTPTILWTGESGKQYKYWIYPIGQKLKGTGNYCFAKETTPNHFVPLYFGQTEALETRFLDHHKEECIMKQGATHVQAHLTNGGAQVRRDEESDLIAKWNPGCNG